MDVYSLAPALLAFGDLVRESNEVLNEHKTKIAVQVYRIGPGSYDIGLAMSLSVVDHARRLVNDDYIVDPNSILESIFGGMAEEIGSLAVGAVLTSLWMLYRHLRGGKPDATEIHEEHVALQVKGKNINVTQNVYNLYQSPGISEHLARTLAPLDQDGVDDVRVGVPGNWNTRITSDEAREVLPPDYGGDTVLSRQEIELWLGIVQPTLDGTYVWRFNEGGKTLTARMEDKAFIEKIARGQRFGRQDLLKVKLLIVQTRASDGKLKTERIVSKVLDHHEPEQQDELPFEY